MNNNDEYKKCPFCGRLIYKNATECKHCGMVLPYEKKIDFLKAEQDFQRYDPTTRNIARILTIITAMALTYSFLGDVWYQLKHIAPKVSYKTSEPINVLQEDKQTILSTPEQMSIGSGKTYRIILKQAKYSLSGLVVARNTNFWLRGLMQNEFDEVVPIDFGIAWGKVADKKLLQKHCKFKSQKTMGQARVLHERCNGSTPYDFSYVYSHISHNHIIPANDNVAAALLKVKKWDKIKLDGYLVDIIQPAGWTSMTSLSRTDTNPSSRGANKGGGACEIFYVEGIQLGNKYYK